MTEDVDVFVLGGGPAGCATAVSLARAGHSVVVVERGAYDDVRLGETLPPAAQPLLSTLGVWDQFLDDGHAASPGIQSVWGRAQRSHNDFIFNPYGTGWHIDRRRFDAMLAHAAEDAGATVLREACVVASAADANGDWEIGVIRGDVRRRWRTKFLIDATGRASTIARKRGGRRRSCDHLIGAVGFLPAGSPHRTPNQCTLVEAVEEGWWYSAFLPDTRCVVAYMTDADLYARGVLRSDCFWQEQLDKARFTRARVPAVRLESPPIVVAANSFRTDPPSGRNWLAVGDAAVAFDPLSSQGISKALQSGLEGARAAAGHLSGDDTLLHDYSARISGGFERYLQVRRAYYGKEGRWRRSAFWWRRRG